MSLPVGTDFTIAATTITFTAGQTEVSTLVTAIDDGIAETTSETFTVVLSYPSTGLAIGDDDTAIVTITDNTGSYNHSRMSRDFIILCSSAGPV